MSTWAAPLLGFLKALIGPLSTWWAGRQGERRGREAAEGEAEREHLKNEIAARDAKDAAADAVRDDAVADGLSEWRRQRGGEPGGGA